ncbi:hypothetical protein CYMTET_38271 [Cymbomonas tetramitiformis]|uniref:Uncharacterized protein n=1 Tax=Cymbomonas tetramitiformis TaxID=36881 RepID=A0AAE0F5E0_9CHLO|nr:hypothetical protein CYMTET_38271 [Cymbomonas tetramitiformis]
MCEAEGEIKEPQIREGGPCNAHRGAGRKRRSAEDEAFASEGGQLVGLWIGAGDGSAGRGQEALGGSKLVRDSESMIWAGTGVIGKVLTAANPPLSVMKNDLNVHLGWKEVRDALQSGNCQLWRKQYEVCDAVVTSQWFAVLNIAFPLAVLASRVVACIHVPS